MASGGYFQRFGKPGKAGKVSRPEQVPGGAPSGPSSGGNAIPGPAIRYGVQPIPASFGRRLWMMTSLVSPSVAGRFRPQDRGYQTNRSDGDPGTLQTFSGSYQGPQTARLGAQAGPSSQPAFPSTNAGDITGSLAQMGLPDIWRIRGT